MEPRPSNAPNAPTGIDPHSLDIFEDIAIGVALVSLEGRPVRCNPALQRLLGYSEAELQGMLWPEFTHPDDVAADRKLQIALVSGERQDYQIEKRYLHKSGQIIWARLTVSGLRSAGGALTFVIATVEDITERKLAELALRESEEKFSRAFNGSPNPIAITRLADGRIVEANDEFARWFGVPAAVTKGRTAFDFGLWNSVEEREDVLRIVRTEGSVRNHEKTVTLPSGDVRTTLISMQPLVIGGENCLLTISTDVTRQKVAERAREELARQLLSAQEQERQRIASELHDGIGQNLSIIQNHVHLALRRPDVSPAAAEQFQAISGLVSEAITEVRRLVQNLRPLQIEKLGLTDALRELIEKVSFSTSIRIDHRLDNVDDVIQGTAATHLYRIVQEALTNLIKHSGASNARLLLERDVHCIRLSIADNGGGFAVDDRPQHLGLGLLSLEERARLIGGTLKLQSVPGKGTMLVVELPIGETPGGSHNGTRAVA